MTKLNELVKNVEALRVEGEVDLEIVGLAFDSRKVQKGFAFFALKGTHVDGHNFITTAIQQGAAAVICETIPEEHPSDVTFVQVGNSSKALGFMASSFYGEPSKSLN